MQIPGVNLGQLLIFVVDCHLLYLSVENNLVIALIVLMDNVGSPIIRHVSLCIQFARLVGHRLFQSLNLVLL